MAQHEGGHAVASRLVGVEVEVLKVSQRLPEDRFDRLSPKRDWVLVQRAGQWTGNLSSQAQAAGLYHRAQWSA
jgi:hypothetical protein